MNLHQDPTKKRRSPVLPLLLLSLSIISLFIPWHRLFKQNKETNQKESNLAVATKYYQRRQFQELFRLSGSIDPKSETTPEIYSLSARALIELGNIRDARKALERSLDLKIEQPEPLGMLAALYLASGESQKGLALLQLVAKLEPANYKPWLAMGKVYQDMGELKDAAKSYGEALSRNPPDDDKLQATAGQIQSLLDDNQTNEARELVEKAIQQGISTALVYGQAALVYQESGDSEKASELAGKAIQLNPEEPNALLALARLSLLKNNIQDAENYLTRANRAKPNQQPVLQLLMQAQARQGKTREAEQTKAEFQKLSARIIKMDKLTQEINARPEDAELRFQLGLLALEGNMQVLAEQCFKASLDINPEFGPARMMLDKMNQAQPNAQP